MAKVNGVATQLSGKLGMSQTISLPSGSWYRVGPVTRFTVPQCGQVHVNNDPSSTFSFRDGSLDVFMLSYVFTCCMLPHLRQRPWMESGMIS